MNLYKKYKGTSLDEIFGHKTIVKELKNRFAKDSIPNIVFLFGKSGKGKTTLSDIIAKWVVCEHRLPNGYPCNECDNCKDVDNPIQTRAVEKRFASRLGIDDVREIEDNIYLTNMFSDKRVYVINEFQALSKNPVAMEAMLEMLGDKDLPNVYFILVSMDETAIPEKLKDAITSRGTSYHLRDIPPEDLLTLVSAVYQAETNLAPTPDMQKLLMAIVYNAKGSARNALQLLERLIESGIMTEDELLAEANIVSENKIQFAMQALMSGDTRGFFASIPEMNEEIYFKLRANLVTLFQLQLGAELGWKSKYVEQFRNKLDTAILSKLIEILNTLKNYPAQTDYVYVVTQCLFYVSSMKPKIKERQPL